MIQKKRRREREDTSVKFLSFSSLSIYILRVIYCVCEVIEVREREVKDV